MPKGGEGGGYIRNRVNIREEEGGCSFRCKWGDGNRADSCRVRQECEQEKQTTRCAN